MKRIKEIDGLRGIAAISVMLFHYTYVFNKDWKFGELFHYGYMGVSVFFIISGFVISMSIQNKKSVKNFLQGRVIRLFPTYWITMLITVFAMFLANIDIDKLNIFNILINLTMLQRFLGFKDIDGAYWTLAVELIFYFFLAFILLFKKVDKMIIIFSVTVFLILLIRMYLNFTLPIDNPIYKMVKQFAYLHLFLAGIVFYKIYKTKATIKDGIILLFCLFCNLEINMHLNIYVETFIVFLIMTIFFLLTSGKGIFFNFLNSKGLQFLGKISYPLYLLNENFGRAIFTFLGLNFIFPVLVKILIVSIIVIITASLVHFFIEVPVFSFLKMKANKPEKLILKKALI